MYQPATLADINQRRREREMAAARVRMARTIGRRRSTSDCGGVRFRFRRRVGAAACQVDER